MLILNTDLIENVLVMYKFWFWERNFTHGCFELFL